MTIKNRFVAILEEKLGDILVEQLLSQIISSLIAQAIEHLFKNAKPLTLPNEVEELKKVLGVETTANTNDFIDAVIEVYFRNVKLRL